MPNPDQKDDSRDVANWRQISMQLSMKMPKDVLCFLQWYISATEDRKRMAMVCGGFNAVINETWIRLASRNKPWPPLKWTTIWCNQLKWTMTRLYHKSKRRPVPLLREFVDCSYEQEFPNLECQSEIAAVLKSLTFREREIIRLRYGLGDGFTYTLEEVGRILKMSRERVRQIEYNAMKKLQRPPRCVRLQKLVLIATTLF